MFHFEKRSVRLTAVGGLVLLILVALAVMRYYLHGRDAGAAVVFAGCVVGVYAALVGWVALLGVWLPRWSVRKDGPLAEVAASDLGTVYFASGTLGLAIWMIDGLARVLGQASTGSDVFPCVFAVGFLFPVLLELRALNPFGLLRCLLLVLLEPVGSVAVLVVVLAASTPLMRNAGIVLALVLTVGAGYGILRVAASFARGHMESVGRS